MKKLNKINLEFSKEVISSLSDTEIDGIKGGTEATMSTCTCITCMPNQCRPTVVNCTQDNNCPTMSTCTCITCMINYCPTA